MNKEVYPRYRPDARGHSIESAKRKDAGYRFRDAKADFKEGTLSRFLNNPQTKTEKAVLTLCSIALTIVMVVYFYYT